jgi:hypothetical protein
VRIPLLHPRGQLALRPFLCHRLVLLTLIFGQLLPNLIASSFVVGEIVRRSRRVFRKLNCQLVYFFSVHGGQHVSVRPFSGFECSFRRSPFEFAVEMLANKLGSLTLITVSLSNSTSCVQVLFMHSAASLTIFSQRSGLAARNLGTRLSNMLMCSSVRAISWLDTHYAFNCSAQ